jgi:8-oxo-dGTP pyrophosphatase MutT (NUDIX family)
MYKIYVNETPLLLIEDKELDSLKSKTLGRFLFARYTGKTKHLFHYLDLLEKGSDWDGIVVYHRELEVLKDDLFGLLRTIYAAGGVVRSSADNLLLIFRLGKWDLPKGKIEVGEEAEMGALREVREETGIHHVAIEQSLGRTYHLYRSPRKGVRCLKVTDWYAMVSSYQEALIPQIEEEISEAIWLSWPEVMARRHAMFKNIEDILLAYKKLRDSQP